MTTFAAKTLLMKAIALFFLSVIIISCSKNDNKDDPFAIDGKYKGLYQFKTGVRMNYDTMYTVDYSVARTGENSASFTSIVNTFDTDTHSRFIFSLTLEKILIVEDGDTRKIFSDGNILLAQIAGDTLIAYIDSLGGFSKAYRLQ